MRDKSGKLQPKLVELQGFPSLYAYQAILSQVCLEIFELDPKLEYLLGGLDWEGYKSCCDAPSWVTTTRSTSF